MGDRGFVPGPLLEVRRASDDASVFSAAPTAWNGGAVHVESGDQAWWLDFSSVTNPVATGIVPNMGKTGTNVTGVSDM